MGLTYADMVKMPLPKLREHALKTGKIHGVHGSNKQQLIREICEIEGIVDESKVAAEKRRQKAQKEIAKLKKKSRDLCLERDKKRPKLSRKELNEYRKQIKKLKRESRELART